MHVKSVESSNVLPLVWCDTYERGMPAQVSSTSLDHGSKLCGPSPKALVQLNSVTLIFTHFMIANKGKILYLQTYKECYKKELEFINTSQKGGGYAAVSDQYDFTCHGKSPMLIANKK
ncbi:hypothetical protein TNCV_4127281 [Trichonephila clavipes]|uniref:Uncharacterized protein n=1 Tax=Trichonephila clavipes TaxID=2585209 RepID=A0A8X6T3I2_TRICX|nr:hypothetical protein TNCV_4127281 [Trichonephila clavipes]